MYLLLAAIPFSRCRALWACSNPSRHLNRRPPYSQNARKSGSAPGDLCIGRIFTDNTNCQKRTSNTLLSECLGGDEFLFAFCEYAKTPSLQQLKMVVWHDARPGKPFAAELSGKVALSHKGGPSKDKVTEIVRPEDVAGSKVTRIVREALSRQARSPRLSFRTSVQARSLSKFA